VKSKKPLYKRIVLWLISIALFFACALFAFTAILFNQVFGRNELDAYEIAIGYSDIDPGRYPRTQVVFQSGDANLKGYIYNASDTAEGLILIAHGIASGADSYLPEIMYFVDNNWCVFAFDGTGTRDSEGKGIRGLPQTKLDVRAALSYINSNTALNGYPIVLYGQSMGGYAVTSVLEDRIYDISAVVCVSGFNSPLDIMYWQSKSVAGFCADIMYPFFYLYEKMLFGKDANAAAIDGINATDTPVMIVYGTADETVPSDIVGIPAYRDKITNKNVIFNECDVEFRNRHATVQLTQKAAKYLYEKRAELDELLSRYGNKIPETEWSAFYNGIDKERMNEIDTGYMWSVLDFYRKNTKREAQK